MPAAAETFPSVVVFFVAGGFRVRSPAYVKIHEVGLRVHALRRMPERPMPLTSRIQSLGIRALGHEAHVVEVAHLSPSIVRVRAAARRAVDARFEPGCKIKVHVGAGQMRSYTPASRSTAAGV